MSIIVGEVLPGTNISISHKYKEVSIKIFIVRYQMHQLKMLERKTLQRPRNCCKSYCEAAAKVWHKVQ